MTAKFDGSSGAWPAARGAPRVTNADIIAAQQDCPSVFAAEVAAAEMFIGSLPMFEAMGLKIEQGMTADEIRIAAFRAASAFGSELNDALTTPADEVRDE
jgi:hypothetical protein